MHEGGIAESIVDILKDIKEKNALSRITSVTLRIGDMSGVMPDALKFALDAIKYEEDIIKYTDFKIDRVKVEGKCLICGRTYKFENAQDITLMCKECRFPLEIIHGKEMTIADVEGE